MTILEVLSKYENKYFNCKKSKMVSYLKYNGIQVESLFYYGLESTSNLIKHMSVEGNKRWYYQSNCLEDEDLEVLGVEAIQSQHSGFMEIFNFLVENLNEMKEIFITLDVFCLPHKEIEYKKEHEIHWVILTRYNPEDQTFDLLDDRSNNTGDFITYRYPRQLVEDGFNQSTKRMMYFNFKEPKDEFNRIFTEKGSRYIQGMHEDFYYYQHIKELLIDIFDRNQKLDQLDYIIDSLILLSGSRYVFMRYLEMIRASEAVIAEYQHISYLADVAKNMLIKSKFSTRFNKASLFDLIDQLANGDRTAYENLKEDKIIKGC
ncbi:hypothetical protein [Paenibacillus taichungensis]|uniref:hypothetical protein n=1 Tax=Paenibacillus taichungensis TaxID=484184 RepID=UPI0038D15BD8